MVRLVAAFVFGFSILGFSVSDVSAGDTSACAAEVKKLQGEAHAVSSRAADEAIRRMLSKAADAAAAGKKKKCEKILNKAKDRIAEG